MHLLALNLFCNIILFMQGAVMYYLSWNEIEFNVFSSGLQSQTLQFGTQKSAIYLVYQRAFATKCESLTEVFSKLLEMLKSVTYI